MSTYFHPRGSLSAAGREVTVGPDGEAWRYTGLEVLTLRPCEPVEIILRGREGIVVPLQGGLEVRVAGGETVTLEGRASPWGVTDVLYLPVDSRVQLVANGAARVALPWARAERAYPVQYRSKAQIQPELRGAGLCSRQINGFGMTASIEADRLLACEVMHPGGNWSSYPPHKHDTDTLEETQLEEIYYYEIGRSPAGTPGFALQRVYGSTAGAIDMTVEVRSGDVVRIPFGYHGPTVAAPGHDLYYLNVMAGPRSKLHKARQWLVTYDRDHDWIRRQWQNEAIDPRLPYGGSARQSR